MCYLDVEILKMNWIIDCIQERSRRLLGVVLGRFRQSLVVDRIWCISVVGVRPRLSPPLHSNLLAREIQSLGYVKTLLPACRTSIVTLNFLTLLVTLLE